VPPSCFRPTPHDSARPSLHRVPAGPVPLLPRYYDALRLPTVHPAALRFLRLAVPRGRLRFAPAGQAIFMARLRPCLHVETVGPPTFLGNPLCLCPALRPRQGRRTRPFGTSARPPLNPRRRPPRLDLSRLNHMASALAVYASQHGSPHHHARLASGCRPGSAGRASYPQSSYERFQSCILHLILLSQASWRKDSHLGPSSAGFRSRVPGEGIPRAGRTRKDSRSSGNGRLQPAGLCHRFPAGGARPPTTSLASLLPAGRLQPAFRTRPVAAEEKPAESPFVASWY